MSVPEAVRKQAEEAEAALDALQQQADGQTPEPTPDQTTTESMEEQPGQQAEPIEAQPDDIVKALQKELDLERQRTRTLQGRIDSQLASANRENKGLKEQLSSMQERIELMEKSSAIPGPRRHITDEEAQELGDDVLGMQERIIKGTLEEELESGSIRDFVKGLVQQSLEAQQTESVQNPVNQKLFWQAVERYYPGAEEINNRDSAWFAFLDLHDPQSGLRNRELGTMAIDNGDVNLLVDMLSQYKPLAGHVEGQRKPSVKPEKTGSDAVIKEAVKPSWSKSEVERFYEDVARNRFRGTKEEALAMENEIMAAAQEGRITA